MQTRILIPVVMAFSVLLLAGPGAFAAQSRAQSKLESKVESLKAACQSDINKFCKGVTPGEGRIAACLDSREDQLSSGCKSEWTGTKIRVSKRMDQADIAFRKNCGSDVQKFCSNIPSGRGRLLDCLNGYKGDLSNSCQNFYSKLDQRLEEILS